MILGDRAAAEKELYSRVEEVLHYVWDPIGVSHAPGARDEYWSYLPYVYELLMKVSGTEKIADYLGTVTSTSMGMGRNHERDLEVGEILVNWKEHLLE